MRGFSFFIPPYFFLDHKVLNPDALIRDFAALKVGGALIAKGPGAAVAPGAQGLAKGEVIARVQQFAVATLRSVGEAGVAKMIELIENKGYRGFRQGAVHRAHRRGLRTQRRRPWCLSPAAAGLPRQETV